MQLISYNVSSYSTGKQGGHFVPMQCMLYWHHITVFFLQYTLSHSWWPNLLSIPYSLEQTIWLLIMSDNIFLQVEFTSHLSTTLFIFVSHIVIGNRLSEFPEPYFSCKFTYVTTSIFRVFALNIANQLPYLTFHFWASFTLQLQFIFHYRHATENHCNIQC